MLSQVGEASQSRGMEPGATVVGTGGRGTRIYAEVSSVEAKERCQAKADKIGAAPELILSHWASTHAVLLESTANMFY